MKARLMILAIISLLLAGSAVAQNSWTKVATFDVPFDFVVNGTTLPSGSYVVRTYMLGNTLMVQNVDTGQSVISNNNIMLTGNPDKIHETTKVVFGLNSDGRQVLHQISITGDDHAHDLTHDQSVTELVPSR